MAARSDGPACRSMLFSKGAFILAAFSFLLSAGDSDSDGPYARNAAKRDQTDTIKQRQLNAAAVSAQHDGSGCGSALWETACKRRCFNKIRIWEEK